MLKLHKATVDKRAKKRQKFVKDLQDYAHVAEKTIQSEIKAFEKDWNTALDQDKSYKKKIHRLGKILDHCWELHKTLFNDYSATITHSHDKATELLKNQKALLRLLETKSRLKKSSVAKLQASTKKSLEILEAYTTNMTTLQNVIPRVNPSQYLSVALVCSPI
ncbi:hypothetical protein AAMO2058_001711600 [Amorphochlora amoebiformis]|eukprot:932892-Amorphochlora_amoeboformis.AAC.1